MMKNILYLVFLLFSLASEAQSGFNYQRLLRNIEGQTMANASIDFRFRLMRQTTLPDQFDLEEECKTMTNKFGVSDE